MLIIRNISVQIGFQIMIQIDAVPSFQDTVLSQIPLCIHSFNFQASLLNMRSNLFQVQVRQLVFVNASSQIELQKITRKEFKIRSSKDKDYVKPTRNTNHSLFMLRVEPPMENILSNLKEELSCHFFPSNLNYISTIAIGNRDVRALLMAYLII